MNRRHHGLLQRGKEGIHGWNKLNVMPMYFLNGLFECCKWTDDSQYNHFLFIVTPDEADESDAESWEGSIKRMSKLSSSHMEEIKTTLDTKIDALSDFIEQNEKKDVA